MNFVYLFPGQGSQYVGMAASVIENWSRGKDLISQSSDILGYDLENIMKNGPAEILQQTLYTQPALFVSSMIVKTWLEENLPSIEPEMVAGHSLGELSALCSCGALSFTGALNLVKKRAELMQEANSQGVGGMAAILGLSAEKIENICNQFQELSIANYNSPNQIVITGSLKAMEISEAAFREAGAKRFIRLNVGGAFHSYLMQNACEEFSSEVDKIIFSDPRCPIISNYDAKPSSISDEIKFKLKKQMISSVRWTETMYYLRDNLIDTVLLEIGSGSVLKGLAKQAAGEMKCASLDKWEDLVSFKTEMESNG
ncbi:MAG: ACP S-malonyltransferase [Candidatus Coatesbacteria bacterium]|nr:ACP S-malonyltransferase [Candidatus Coatesbacteria bacterium]